MRRVVELPARGRLLVATDLQGNLGDFDRIAALFEEAARSEEGAHLVLTGDLVHGPELEPEQWPEYLGSYYRGESVALIERALALAARHPDRVHYLLGNHEHAHVGGPVVGKFFSDEAARLEELLGPERSARVREWFLNWPLLAYAPRARLLMLHAAPFARIAGVEELEQLRLDGWGDAPVADMAGLGTLGALLWARATTPERAWDFLRAIHPDLCVAVYGHDVARSGFAIDHEPLLCISTSFGCYDGDKTYLDWDLAAPARSAADVAARGLRPLHPGAAPVFHVAAGRRPAPGGPNL